MTRYKFTANLWMGQGFDVWDDATGKKVKHFPENTNYQSIVDYVAKLNNQNSVGTVERKLKRMAGF